MFNVLPSPLDQDHDSTLGLGRVAGNHGIQDCAVQESMGPIADRSEDLLGSSDKAIFTFRTQMYRAAQAVQKGEPALGMELWLPDIPVRR